MELNESPLTLLMNTRIDNSRKDLPLTLYETGRKSLDDAGHVQNLRALAPNSQPGPNQSVTILRAAARRERTGCISSSRPPWDIN